MEDNVDIANDKIHMQLHLKLVSLSHQRDATNAFDWSICKILSSDSSMLQSICSQPRSHPRHLLFCDATNFRYGRLGYDERYECFEAFDWPIGWKNFINWPIKECFEASSWPYPSTAIGYDGDPTTILGVSRNVSTILKIYSDLNYWFLLSVFGTH